MHYLQNTNVFPTLFEFQNPKSDDVVHYFDWEANAALTISESPLEILGIDHINVVVAWKRQQEAKSYSTLVIPESRAKTLMVQKRHFEEKFIKNNYIQRKFTACTHLDFISDKLYLLPQDPPNAVCLKSPNLFFYDPNACRLRVAKDGITFNPSTDDETFDSDFTEPAPPIPERIPITCPQVSEIAKKKIGLFHNVHIEIKSLYKKRFKSRRRKRRGEQMREQGGYLNNTMHMRSKSMPDAGTDEPDNDATRNERLKKKSTKGYRRPPAPLPVGAVLQQSTTSTTSVLSTPTKSNSSSPNETQTKPISSDSSTSSKSKSESSSPIDTCTTKTKSVPSTVSRSKSASSSPTEIRREMRSKSMPDAGTDEPDNDATRNERLKKYSTKGYRRPPAPLPVGAVLQQSTTSTTSVLSTPTKSNSSSPNETQTKPTSSVSSTSSKSKSESSSPIDTCTTKTKSVPSTVSRSKSASSSPAEIRREMRPLPEIRSTHSDEDSDGYVIQCPSVAPRPSIRAPSSSALHRPELPIPSYSNHGDHVIASSAPTNNEPRVYPATLTRTTHPEHAKEKPGYATVSQKDMQSIMCPGQTSENYPSDSNHGNNVIAPHAATNTETRDHPATFSRTAHSEHANEKPGYATISQKDMQSILCPGQTSDDFYKLSVIKLYHLLKHCSLNDIADICYKELFDGKFFANIDVQEFLQVQPFSASNIQILKFKKIQDGWRPNISH